LELLKSNKPYNEIRQIINYRDIICDSIGKLLQLYAIGNFAYVGGGFGEGVHSVAEPGGYGLPLSCGPKIKNHMMLYIFWKMVHCKLSPHQSI